MPLLEKERVPLGAAPRRKGKAWLIVSLCLITALTVAVATLTVEFVMRSKAYQNQISDQSAALSTLEERISDLQTEQQSAASRMEEQDKTISDQQSTLEEQNKTISDLQSQIAAYQALLTPSADGVSQPAESLVVQVPPEAVGAKLVALTFDDGPGPYTAKLLDELKARNIHATFFVLGSKVDKYPDLIRRMAEEGHVVGNHSQNHKNLKNLSAQGVRDEMEACATRIEQITGQRPSIMRCPGGNCNNTVKDYAASVGIPIAYWDVDTRDWESRNVNSILNVAFNSRYKIQDGSIVLMHDIYETTLNASIQMMDRLLKEGYTFVTVPQLLTLRGGIAPGQVYNAAYPS